MIYITSDFDWSKNMSELRKKINWKTIKNYWTFTPSKKFFFFIVYKMVDISAETWSTAWVYVLGMHENDDVNKTLILLLCVSNISERLNSTNKFDLIDKEIKRKYNVKKMNEVLKQQIIRYKIDRSRLIKGSMLIKCMYVNEVIVIPIIMQTRLLKPEKIKFRSDLGFNQINLILKKRTIRSNTNIKSISCRKNKSTSQSLIKWTSKNWYLSFWAWSSSRN